MVTRLAFVRRFRQKIAAPPEDWLVFSASSLTFEKTDLALAENEPMAGELHPFEGDRVTATRFPADTFMPRFRHPSLLCFSSISTIEL